MNAQHLLGQLSGLHQMINQLLESVPEGDAYRSYHPHIAPLAWYLGRSMYIETFWLREVVQEEPGMTERVRELFTPGALPQAEQWRRLPPRDHLLNWALELQDENLMRLANSGRLPEHPLLADQRLQHLILQEHAWNYEHMLMVLIQRQLQQPVDYRVSTPLQAATPSPDLAAISQGHYRIGARDECAAYDNEEPAQVVNLSNFRIERLPVSNAAWLAFMQAGGYSSREYWSERGWHWLTEGRRHPDHWRQDDQGNWYARGLNGPFDLMTEEPVMGISQHEATAYASWLSGCGGELDGAVVQHEFQWEIAARTREISGYGRVWEWCSNRFQPYSDYQAPLRPEARTLEFDDHHYSLRGASLHTQRPLKRPTFRNRARPEQRFLFAGTRLVFPPA